MIRVLACFFVFFSFSLEAKNLKGRVVPKEGTLGENALFVISVVDGAKYSGNKRKPRTLKMSQLEKKFHPPVLAMHLNDSIDFPNLDNFFHNVFSLDPKNKFDLGLFKKDVKFKDDKKTIVSGEKLSLHQFSHPGKVRLFCNVHPDMKAQVHVFDHPYFAITSKSLGEFKLPLPAKVENLVIELDGPFLEKPIRKRIKGKKFGKVTWKVELKDLWKEAQIKKDGKPVQEDAHEEFY